MKNNIEFILNFIQRYGIYIVTLIIFILLLNKCNTTKDLKNQIKKDNQNISALNDSIKKQKLKNGQLEYSINGFIASEKNLKQLNNDLYNRLKNESGKVLFLNSVLIKLQLDTIELRNALNIALSKLNDMYQINDSTWKATWSLVYDYGNNNSDVFSGQTFVGIASRNPLKLKHINTELINRTTKIDLTFGQKIEDKKLRIFISSKYPGFSTEQLQGVLIDPASNNEFQKLIPKKHWFQGFHVGFGITPGFNLSTGKYGLVIGPTFSYSFYSL